MEQPFNHTEWTISQLDERLKNLTHFILSMPHSDERRNQLEHERACVDYELSKQIMEAVNGTAETDAGE